MDKSWFDDIVLQPTLDQKKLGMIKGRPAKTPITGEKKFMRNTQRDMRAFKRTLK